MGTIPVSPPHACSPTSQKREKIAQWAFHCLQRSTVVPKSMENGVEVKKVACTGD